MSTEQGEDSLVKQLVTKFRHKADTALVRVSLLNGVSTLIRMMAGLVSTKVIASIVGPTGIALLGQLNNFTTIVLSFANGGITTGVTKYVSEHTDAEKRTQEYISTAFRVTLLFSLITALVLFVCAGYLSDLIFKSREHRIVFYIFGATIFFYAFNAIVLAIFNGFKAYRKLVTISIYNSIASLFFSVIMAITLGLRGALIAIVTYQSVVFLITLKLVYTSSWFSWENLRGVWHRKVVRQLLQFSLMALSTALITPLSQLLVRSQIASTLSVGDAGIWEGINRISGTYLQVVVASLSIYYLPRLAELKNDGEIRKEVFSVYKLVIPFLVASTVGIYILRDIIISLLFTKEFAGMRDLFLFQLAGDLLKMTGWVLGFILVAKAMTRTFIMMELFNYGIFVLLSYMLVPVLGLNGSTIAYAIGHGVYLAGMLIIFRKMLWGPVKG